jgi:hypothetical protein
MDEPVAHLPEAYARYFALLRSGLRLDQIASELGIPDEAMESFVQIANSKIANTLARRGGVDGGGRAGWLGGCRCAQVDLGDVGRRSAVCP